MCEHRLISSTQYILVFFQKSLKKSYWGKKYGKIKILKKERNTWSVTASVKGVLLCYE